MTAPRSVGHPDPNPSRAPLEAGEDAAAYMRVRDGELAREAAAAAATVTEVLERSMGLPAGRLARVGSGAAAGQLKAAQARIEADKAAATGKRAAGSSARPAAGAAASSEAATAAQQAPYPAGGVPDDVAEKLVAQFFARYNAGDKVVAPPSPPQGGYRMVDPPARSAAGAKKKEAAPAAPAKKKK